MKGTLAKIGKMGISAKKKAICIFTAVMMSLSGMATTAFADNDAKLQEVTSPVIDLLNQVFNVLIPVVGAAGAIFCIFLGVKFAKAEEPQEREKAKSHLKNAIIGFVLIFVLVVALRIAIPNLADWMDSASSSAGSSK